MGSLRRKISVAFIFFAFLASHSTFAQWHNGSNIYNTNSGYVGIGASTTPTSMLHVFGGLTLDTSGGAVLWKPQGGTGATMKMYNPAGSDLRIFGASDLFTFTASGSLGIGVTAPRAALSLAGGVGGAGQIGLLGNAGSLSNRPGIYLGSNGNFSGTGATAYFGFAAGLNGYINDFAIVGSADPQTHRYLHIGYNTNDDPSLAFNPRVSIDGYGGSLTAAGQIYSQSGGFKFPDGTVQSTAAAGGGSATAANVSAGAFGANTSGGNYSFPGGVAIGTATQAGILNVVGGAGGWAQFQRSGKLLYVNANYSDVNEYGFLGMRNTDGMGLSLSSSDQHPEYFFISNAGNVSVNGMGATFKTEISHSANATTPFANTAQIPLGLINTDPTAGNYSFISFASTGGGSVKAGVGAQYLASNVTDLVFGTHNGSAVAEKMRITGAGAVNVTGTIHSTGAITSDVGIHAVYQDLAEWVPAAESLAPGTVVVLNPARGREVMASSSTYDTTVAGVVSEHPGITLGREGADKAQIATTGRVKVKVDATGNPIRVGDLLVTSGVAGTAMRSVPVPVAGVSMHRPGTIIGKALEPLESGTGEILVLLSLQ